jgi:hypothetical protein
MQILGTILCIFINSPLLLRIPQKSALLSITLCAQFRTERLNINGVTRQITIYLMPRAALQSDFGLFFFFLALKSCLFTHCCGTIQCSLYLPWRFGSYAISLIGVCFAQSRAIIFIERKNHYEKKMRQTHC